MEQQRLMAKRQAAQTNPFQAALTITLALPFRSAKSSRADIDDNGKIRAAQPFLLFSKRQSRFSLSNPFIPSILLSRISPKIGKSP